MRPVCVVVSPISAWLVYFFFFSSRRRHTRYIGDWSSDVCSSDLERQRRALVQRGQGHHVQRRVEVLRVVAHRSEERRVGKECRARWSADRLKDKMAKAWHEKRMASDGAEW